MREFIALEWTAASGRGPIAIIADPGDETIHDLLHAAVSIDGVAYTVTGIEAFQVAGGRVVRGRPWGLLVKRAPDGAEVGP